MGGGLIQFNNAPDKKITIRNLKKKAESILERSNDYNALLRISEGPVTAVINALFSLLYNKNPVIKWNAVTAIGKAVSDLAETDMEAARNIIRRLMWNLNDESGGIGWGSAEALGEILSESSMLAKEYAHILFSYASKDGNFQEHELMQRGVLWGIGRFCDAWPERVNASMAKTIMPFLDSNDAHVAGFAAWVLGSIRANEAINRLKELRSNESPVQFFYKGNLKNTSVRDLAQDALVRIKKQ